MTLSQAALAYLARVGAGDAHVMAWREWCDAHRVELERALSRKRYLDLKFRPRESLPALLDELEIDHEPDALAAHLENAAHGLPWDWVPRDVLGVQALYAQGGEREADRRIAAHIDGLVSRVAWEDVDAARELGELVLDAEALLTRGQRACALAWIRAVAALPVVDDLLDPAIRHARELLREP